MYEPESNSIEADVLNAPEVTVATSMGFSMRRSIMANRLAYTFEEPLEAGTQIIVSEGPAFAEVYTPSTFEYIGFDRVTGVVTATAKGPAATARITTTYGVDETVMLSWNGTNKTFEYTLTDIPDGAFDFVLYIDQSHYTYQIPAKPAGKIDKIQYDILTSQAWINATSTGEAEAVTSTGKSATLDLLDGGDWFIVGQPPLEAGDTITVTSIDDELTYTVPTPVAFDSVVVDDKKVTVTGATTSVGFFFNDTLYATKYPDGDGKVEHTFASSPVEGDRITVKASDNTKIGNYVEPADPNKNALYDVRMTLRADGKSGHRANVAVGDTAYMVITPKNLVTNKQVRLDLNLQMATATIVGGNLVTLVPGEEKIVAITVDTATSEYSFIGVSVMDPKSGGYLVTSRQMFTRPVPVVPTGFTVNPENGHGDAETGLVINYLFNETPYSGKSVVATANHAGVTAVDYILETNQIDEGNIYVKFDPAQLNDLDVVEVTITIDGMTAVSSITYHEASA